MDPKVIKTIDRAVTAILVLAVIALVSYIRVGGREIDGISEMTDTNCTVTITTYQHMEWDDRVEHELGPEQILELKALILDSTFTRGLFRDAVTFDDRDMYDIVVNYNKKKYVSIHSIGNEYISISGEIWGSDVGFLKIHNKNWKAALNELIEEN